MATLNSHSHDDYDAPPLPYTPGLFPVGYSQRNEKEKEKDKERDSEKDLEASDDGLGEDAALRPSYPPSPYHYSVPPRYDHAHSGALLYPPSRKGSHASSVNVSDIIESYESSASQEDIFKPPKPVTTSKRALLASFIPSSLACRLYLLVALVETIIDVLIEVELYLRLKTYSDQLDQNSEQVVLSVQRLPIYILLFGLAHLYQFILAVDAVRSRNMLQIIFLTAFNALFLGYSVIQITEIKGVLPPATPGIVSIPVNVVTTLTPIVISVAEVAYLLLSWKLYGEFGWEVYKLLGADRRIKRMFFHYQIFESFLKFDVFFCAGFSIQFIAFVLVTESNVEYYITIVALPVSLLLLLEGHLAARHENKWLMGSFMVGCIGGCVYFLYKLFRIIMENSQTDLENVWKSLTIFSALSITLLLSTFIWACIVLANFDKGLKLHMNKNPRVPDSSDRRRQEPGFRNPNRMSIE